MSKNGQLSLTPKAKEAAERHRVNMYGKALRLDKMRDVQIDSHIADFCRESWVAGYFYAKQEQLNKKEL